MDSTLYATMRQSELLAEASERHLARVATAVRRCCQDLRTAGIRARLAAAIRRRSVAGASY